MTASLTEQAKLISEEYWALAGGFVFCSKKRAEFFTVKSASIIYDNYAFRIHDQSCTREQFTEKFIIAMKGYCCTHDLEFAEK